MNDESVQDHPLLTRFGKHDEFVQYQETFLSLDVDEEPDLLQDQNEAKLLRTLSDILDEYQEQSYLLDPFLEHLTAPVIERLKVHAKSYVSDPGKKASSTRVGRLALLLYGYIKCRGYKTIIRFFPHETSDLSVALNYMLTPNTPAQDPLNWSLRYVILLWLSLVCMIPFDLAQFDEDGHIGQTASAVESLANGYLARAGLERDGAAFLYSRFFMRKDTRSFFDSFLEWSNNSLKASIDIFTSIGILQVLCEVLKSGPFDRIESNLTALLSIGDRISESTMLSNNTVVRKWKTKFLSRISIRLLPVKVKVSRRKARVLSETIPSTPDDVDNDIDVPDQVELILEQLFQSLQDKDTIVRWSASKGIARIAERLPLDFANQVFDTITELFAVHSSVASALYDMPAIAEGTWHGACLACAEMARRDLVGREKLPKLIGWLAKALYFDIRKGAHSIGSNVRDAAAYVLWSLARAQDTSALAPHADNLAGQLATVALYDREIHIRRATSAAFQEHVGRMNLFPHGIDVLGKTDFYSVSLRRNSFLVAAPQVAEHSEYRIFLFDHLLNVTLRHWDPMMRELGSQSLRRVCLSEFVILGPKALSRAARLLHSVDLNEVHGGLLALTQLALAYRDLKQCDGLKSKLQEIFKYLTIIPSAIIFSPRNGLVTSAACYLIASSVSLTEIQLGERCSVPHWREIIDYGIKHRSGEVQESAASAMAAVSKLVDCSSDIRRLIPELKSGHPTMQQSLGRLLGSLDYATFPHDISEVIQCLLECVGDSSSTKLRNVEARRNCYLAMPRILNTVAPRLPDILSSRVVRSLFNALLDGLNDYAVDERGDVGSWIRIACIHGLTTFVEVLFSHAVSIPNLEEYLPSAVYHQAVGGILKQGVERLDGVRQEAGEHFHRLFAIPPPAIPSGQLWSIRGKALVEELFLNEKEMVGWNDGSWLFPKAVRLLDIDWYRKPILSGLVLSIGSRTDSTQRPASLGLIAYSHSLPISGGAYSLPDLVQDLVDHAKQYINSNAILVPVLQTFNALLEADALGRLSEHREGLMSLEVLYSISVKNVARLKSVPRIIESMKILVNLLTFETLFDRCASRLKDFLAHQFPKVRADTAEYLYLVIQTKDLCCEAGEIEEILLETEWSSTETQEAARNVTELLLKKRPS